jgi:hypothetical protein
MTNRQSELIYYFEETLVTLKESVNLWQLIHTLRISFSSAMTNRHLELIRRKFVKRDRICESVATYCLAMTNRHLELIFDFEGSLIRLKNFIICESVATYCLAMTNRHLELIQRKFTKPVRICESVATFNSALTNRHLELIERKFTKHTRICESVAPLYKTISVTTYNNTCINITL